MEESVQIKWFEHPVSASDFESLVEPRNVPAVFVGCVKNWTALSRWNPFNGGLDYLQERVGSCIVEAMHSRSAPVYYGDLRSHERVPLPFSSFVGLCKQCMQKGTDENGADSDTITADVVTGPELEAGCSRQQYYLAQVPVFNAEDEERVQLEPLREDIQTPEFLERKVLASVNLWMNSNSSRSSTHYDPHHNVLCIVSGSKQVELWPPSASPMLYPMHLYGEASNHSSVALENPDYSKFPRAKCSTKYSQKVILHAGDALFIPEGWFHQVDSDVLTMAVNFWWRSKIMSCMPEHMDAYYLRRILRRLIDREMNQALPKASPAIMDKKCSSNMHNSRERDPDGNDMDQIGSTRDESWHLSNLQELEPSVVDALHGLVSLVHVSVSVSVGDQSQLPQSTSADESLSVEKHEHNTVRKANLFSLEEDQVATYIWNLEPWTFRRVFLAMALKFPRTLEALVLHLLSPVGAEVLTRKFDEMDQITHEEERPRFYEVFYGVFDDQFAVMDVILNGKELYSLQAFRTVLDKYLGVNIDGQELG